MQIVVEIESVPLHGGTESLFAGVAEGRVSDVVDEGEGFGEINIEPKLLGDRAGDLRHLDGMGQAIAEVIADAGSEDLGLVFQSPEGAGVDDAIAVALKVIAIGVRRFGVTAAERAFDMHGVVGEHELQYQFRVSTFQLRLPVRIGAWGDSLAPFAEKQ
jgi:hypothetical protein